MMQTNLACLSQIPQINDSGSRGPVERLLRLGTNQIQPRSIQQLTQRLVVELALRNDLLDVRSSSRSV